MGNMRQVKHFRAIFISIVWLVTLISLGKCQTPPFLDVQFDPYSTDQWFKQKLDHYDTSNIQHWPQRYLTSYRFYRLGGPVFLYLSGPGPELTIRDIESGAFARYAEEQGAFIIGLEHRFYGKSKPTQDLSTPHLHYLTVPQTLEDIAAFIRAWKTRDEFRSSKWVVFGASYLGSVTAWFAQKHPELIDAFVASSAPLELRYEIPEFLETVGYVLNRTDPRCYDTVAAGFQCLTDIFNDQGCNNYNLQDVKDKFDFCSDLDPSRPLDASGAIAELFSTINGVVMYHDPDPTSFPDTNLDRFCRHISSTSGGKSALEKIAEKVREINKHKGTGCAEFRFETTVEFLSEKDWDSAAAKEGYRQLQYQLCNELGWTVAAANISQPFGNYLSPFLHGEICQKLFGLTETEMRLKVLTSNTELNGKNLTTKCGIFVNGDMDPWHTFSISTPYEAGKCNRAILIEGGSHSRDIEEYSNEPSYPPTVREAQVRISRYLDSWLKTGRCCDEDPEDPRRVINSFSRSERALNDNIANKTMNVQIKHRSYPSRPESNERMIASPTASPFQYSATDVLSVSPRIPVEFGKDASSIDPDKFDGNIYRDPRNAEYRRYRIVKLLRHRTTFPSPSTTPSYEMNTPTAPPLPSMEQFEAEFPEYSIRVEGRVEKVYKNGTRIVESTKVSPPRLADEQQQYEMFQRGKKILAQTARPIFPVSPTPKTDLDTNGIENVDENAEKKEHFKYVVKHVFKDVVDPKEIQNGEQNKTESDKKKNENIIAISPKTTAKRQQSLEEKDVALVKKTSDDDSSSSSSSSESTESNETSEKSNGDDEDEDESLSASESSEHSAIDPRTSESLSSTKKKVDEDDTVVSKSEKSKETKSEVKKDEGNKDDEYDDDDYSDEYYDDDDDDFNDNDDGESNKEIKRKTSTKVTGASLKKSNSSRASSNSSTEFTSGEDKMPRRLREKISEKIMSSSEAVEGDQKSKEKTKQQKNSGGKGRGQNNKNEADDGRGDGDEDSLEDSRSSFSEEDYNYSLEPSGSDPQHQYRKSSKKQLVPIARPVLNENGDVINLEISGSYPKRKRTQHRQTHHKKRPRPTTTTTSTTTTTTTEGPESESDSRDSSEEMTTTTTTTKKPRRLRKGRRKPKHRMTTIPPTTTTTKTTTTTTTEASTTLSSYEQKLPKTNNYEAWNRGRKILEGRQQYGSKSIQQEVPDIVNLGVGDSEGIPGTPSDGEHLSSSGQTLNRNDVIYIVIGDVPKEDDGENVVDDKPTGDDLFKFIQKLVSRHSPGILPPPPPRPSPPQKSPEEEEEQEEILPPSPSPRPMLLPQSLPIPTNPVVETPPPPAPPMMNYGFNGPTGKYLLVRPVQIVSLGRDHVVHPNDLNNRTLHDLMTMETPTNPIPYTYQHYHQLHPSQTTNSNMKRQYASDGYQFRSPQHRDQYEKLLSVDGQSRDVDSYTNNDGGDVASFYRPIRPNYRRLDQIADPSWRNIRGLSQFGPVPRYRENPTSGLLSLSAADTQWVDQGVPFLPRGRH